MIYDALYLPVANLDTTYEDAMSTPVIMGCCWVPGPSLLFELLIPIECACSTRIQIPRIPVPRKGCPLMAQER